MIDRISEKIEFIAKILEILAPMYDVTTKKIGAKVYLSKDDVKFGFIENEEFYLMNKDRNYEKLLNSLETKGNLAQDHILSSATKAYWVACWKIPE